MADGSAVTGSMPHSSPVYEAPGSTSSPTGSWHGDHGEQVHVDYHRMDNGARRSHKAALLSGRKGALLKALLFVVVLLLGMVFGFALRPSVREQVNRTTFHYRDGYESYSADVSSQLSKLIDIENIKDNLQKYTQYVHLTATHDNAILRDLLRSEFTEYGLRVAQDSYNVLLSYPNWEHENTVSLVDANDSVVFEIGYRGSANQNHVELRSNYLAFSPNGSAQGELVYANYGTEEDFATLRDQNVSCINNILIMRDGHTAWSVKVHNAERCGAVAAILYCEHTSESSATLHGTVLAAWGDPLSPSLPSLDFVPRLREDRADLPRIPAQVVTFDDAQKLMSMMAGPDGGARFQGLPSADPDLTFRLGPGYSGARKHWKVKVAVHNEMERRDVTNVVGVIEGHEEPDRFVIVGCHYDAWSYGGVDPNTGTAVLMEVARVFGYMATHKDWQPRRTLVFVHWDAAEQGFIGSTEWIQEYLPELSGRTVAYIDLAAAVMGNYTLDIEADPLLRTMLENISRTLTPPVATPRSAVDPTTQAEETLYDRWMGTSSDTTPVNYPQGSSDHVPFVQRLGVATMWPKFVGKDVGDVDRHYPLDTFAAVRQIDPEFHAHRLMTEFMTETVLRLSTVTKLPLDCQRLASSLTHEVASLVANQTDTALYRPLLWAVGNFSVIALDFNLRFKVVNTDNVLETRKYNDQLTRLSSVFLRTRSKSPLGNLLYSSNENVPLGLFPDIRRAHTACSGQTPLCDTLPHAIATATLAVQSATRTLHRHHFYKEQ